VAELEGQVRDLMIHIESTKAIATSDGSELEDVRRCRISLLNTTHPLNQPNVLDSQGSVITIPGAAASTSTSSSSGRKRRGRGKR